MEVIHPNYGTPLKEDLGLNNALLRVSNCGEQVFAGMQWCEKQTLH